MPSSLCIKSIVVIKQVGWQEGRRKSCSLQKNLKFNSFNSKEHLECLNGSMAPLALYQ